ncbi:SUN domain-containing protein 1-like [Pyrus communis]|uniref:SUN domain-containing protein 1-like n=1 Tax=Pyrus communis TaxID=23211 RepID=UPI0035C077FD
MSASTVSITANPATTRRRPVVAVDKKSSNIELVSAEPQTHKADDAATNSKDLSHHSIRGEPGLDRSAQPKKTGPNSTISPPSSRRSRKTLAADPKPRWVTVLRIFSKNFILLVLILGLFQIVRRLALGSGVGVPMAFTDLEGRIAEVEAFMKTTTKMVQVQVEVVDRKIESEVGGLRKEMEKKIEDKGVALESELKKLEAKGEGLERSVGDLRSVEWLSKQEFEKVYEDLKKKVKSSEDGGLGATLDDIRAYARNVVEKEIEKHAADGLGRVDYALATGGASIVKHSEPYLVGKGSNWFSKSTKNGVHGDADRMLRPSFGEPGHCFPLKGTSGFVQIKLRTKIIPEAITLEHVAKSVAYDRSSAPKDCRISGWLQGGDNPEVYTEMFRLAEFTYDLEKSNAQTFTIMDSAVSGLIDTVRLDFTSNHGSPSHTCIYRLRVHGHEPDVLSMMAMQQ